MKKRHKNAKQGRAGVIAVEDSCSKLDLIWRNLLEEDVGIDGTIEIALGEFPTGKIVGAQVKSGTSYVCSETTDSFKFYPDKTDLEYWGGLSIPLFLFVHHPTDQSVYWVDVSQHVRAQENNPSDDTYINFSKANKIDAEFEKYLHARFDLSVYGDNQYAGLGHWIRGSLPIGSRPFSRRGKAARPSSMRPSRPIKRSRPASAPSNATIWR